MAKIGVDMGHCITNGSADTSAVGIVSESQKDREIGKALISKLQALGHTVVNCTVDYANSVNESLQARVDKANANNVDVFVSIHLNAGGGTGVENWVYGLGGKAEQYARNVQNQLVSLGYRDRGVKVGNLYVIRYTAAPAILIECGFVDSQEDCNRFNADAIANAICKGLVGQSVSSQPTLTTPQQPTTKHPIMGKADLTKEQMAQFLLQNNSAICINCTALELAQIFLEEGAKENIRGDVSFAQAIKETGFFKFGGDVLPEQNNYCGLGTTGGGVKGAYFESPRIGVRAMIQHLKAYASNEPLQQTCVDPRYNLIAPKGMAPNWEDLNGRWAVPGNNYGQEIYKLYESIKAIKVDSTIIQSPTNTSQTTTQPSVNKNGYSYGVNGKIINDFFYTRNLDGIPNGGRIDIGDEICILDCSFSKQMLFVEYPTPNGIKTAYIKYVPSCLQLYYENQYHNGSTSETVYFDSSMSSKWGSLDPREQATPLFRKDGCLCVLYRCGDKIKNGFVSYNGNFNKF